MFGLLGFLAAAGDSVNKQRRTEVWRPRVFVSLAFEGPGQAFSVYYYKPSSRGSACSAEAQIQSWLFVYERRDWTGIKLTRLVILAYIRPCPEDHRLPTSLINESLTPDNAS